MEEDCGALTKLKNTIDQLFKADILPPQLFKLGILKRIKLYFIILHSALFLIFGFFFKFPCGNKS